MATYLHYSPMWPSGVPRSKVVLSELILTIQVPFYRGGAGLQYEIGVKNYCQLVPEIHAVKVEQISYVLCA